MVPGLELLVHAGAPSARGDDERFQAQAQSYLSFNGNRVPSLEPSLDEAQAVGRDLVTGDISTSKRDGDFDGSDQSVEVGRNSPAMAPPDRTTFLEDTQSAFAALESQIVTSSLPVSSKRTPLKRRASRLQEHVSSPWSPEDQGTPVARPVIKPRRHASPFQLPVQRSAKSGHSNVTSPSSDTNEPLGPHISEYHGPSQSSYLRSPVLDRSAKKPHREETTRTLPSALQALTPLFVPIQENGHAALGFVGERSPQLAAAVISKYREETPLVQEASLHDEATSELPTTYSLSDITSDSSRLKYGSVQRSVSDPGPTAFHQLLASSKDLEEEDHRQHTAPDVPLPRSPNALRELAAHTASDGVGHNKEHLQLGAVDGIPFASPNACGTNAGITEHAPTASATMQRAPEANPTVRHDLLTIELRALPLNIRLPAPEVSTAGFTTHLTEHLAFLGEQSQLADCYKPIAVSRDLRPLERGCWTFEPSGWATELQIKFWQFLQKMIGDGKAGWGVWATHETLEEANITLGTIKVFCWGEIVKQVYLLLYVASNSKVRKAGLQWLDSSEKVVVQMRG